MPTKTKEKMTLGNTVTFDPITKRFTQKGHVVRGEKILRYPVGICECCFEEYPKHREKQRFCSTPCRLKWWLRQRHNGEDPNYGVGVCPIDDTVFPKTRPWSKYCSPECQAEGIKRIGAEKQREKTTEPF